MNWVARSASLLAFCAALSSLAAAGEIAGILTPGLAKSASPTFESLDRNADNRLSRSEASYSRLLSAIFATSDADGDGFVSRAEYERAVASSAPGNTPGSDADNETRFDTP